VHDTLDEEEGEAGGIRSGGANAKLQTPNFKRQTPNAKRGRGEADIQHPAFNSEEGAGRAARLSPDLLATERWCPVSGRFPRMGWALA
jgi:hypothetical protein